MSKQAIVFFGGTGDLTFRKLIPALYNLEHLGKLEDNLQIIIVGRRDYQDDDYRSLAKKWLLEYARLKVDALCLEKYFKRIHYYKMDMQNEEAYCDLVAYFKQQNLDKRIYYYAVAPKFFTVITNGLYRYQGCENSMVIVEKPFGEDLITARKLNQRLYEAFKPENVYHIDHYLGKEMIQNILNIRFHNILFTEVWNANCIENVQINSFETVGVETRGGYYDDSGALQDMVQNHLFQILSLVAMEPVEKMDVESIHYSQLQVLKNLRPIQQNEIVLGQYEGYTKEDKVDANSKTETYAALEMYIDVPRWKNVPFYIRTGKKLAKRETEIIVQFKPVGGQEKGNLLVLKIQPDEGFYIQLFAKKPGSEGIVQKITLDYCQSCVLENRMNTPEAYERLLEAVFNQDKTLFSNWDQIEVSWEFVNRVKQLANNPVLYGKDSLGPKEKDELLAKNGHAWVNTDFDAFH